MDEQVELIGVILTELDRQGVKTVDQRQLNAVIRASNEIVMRAMFKIDGWEVCQVTWADSQFSGMWFAARDPGRTWCDIRGGFYTEHDYIHEDGIARKSLKDGESWSGYFPTRESVIAAIRR